MKILDDFQFDANRMWKVKENTPGYLLPIRVCWWRVCKLKQDKITAVHKSV